ncbi:MAG TPA: caspase family protein [Longimicrobiales bacterium]|nr:caspase family protein [Longimicrobiales bacterium]
MRLTSIRVPGAALLLLMLVIRPAAAQDRIAFRSELPRTLVFIEEAGNARTATRDVSALLLEAGFPIVDPALAYTAAGRDLVERAVAGDEGAATQLGRDLGAQVVILGKADWGVAPNPARTSLQTATADVSLRAIRLDAGNVLTDKQANGRATDATAQGARASAIRQALGRLLETEFLGVVANNWADVPWSARGYFQPDPGSVGASMSSSPISAGAPRLAIVRTDVLPPAGASAATRGIGVVNRSRGNDDVSNDIDVSGIVVGNVQQVDVAGVRASLEPVDAGMREQLSLSNDAKWFRARVSLPQSQDTVLVAARSVTGEIATATAAARVGERWAVVVGVSEYQSDAIPDLRYAARDAQAFYDFLRSEQAGPFSEERILFLKDGAATAQALRDAMFVFLQQAKFNDLVVIYFAGHGAPDPNMPDNLYLLPSDANINALASTAFPMWDVKTALRRQIRAERVVVIADACHSGGTRDGSHNTINGAFEELFTPSRRLTLTAAADNELSLEDAKWGGGHGVFTYNILEALKGAGDADGNGIVTFDEVAAYVASRVKTETGGRQSPQRSGLGDVPLAVVRQ